MKPSWVFGTCAFLLLLTSLIHAEEAIPVAQSGGGTYPLPLHDEQTMAELQGLAGSAPVKLKVISPQWNEVISIPEVVVKYRLENYEVGQPEPGQHVHVILDNSPYEADYTADGSVIFKNVPEGTHTISVFAARKFHLSLKNPEAFDQVTFHVLANNGRNAPVPGEPQLVYSRPKGSYSKADGSGDNILLDFYLRDVQLSPEGHRVRVTVNEGETVYLTSWKPIILLQNPPVGDYLVTLELVDANDELAPGPFNSTTRAIRITE